MSFLKNRSGVGALPQNFLSDENIGITDWTDFAPAAIGTGFSMTGASLSATVGSMPDLALVPPTGPMGRMPPQSAWATKTEEATSDSGDILLNDPELSKAMFPTVPDERGMTAKRAIAIKEIQDAQAVRDFKMKDRPIQSFALQLLGNIPSPENFIPIFGPAARGLSFGKAVAVTAGKSAAEGAIGTAAFDLATLEHREKLGMDTSWEAITMDIAFGALIGGTIGGGVKSATSIFEVPSSRATPPGAMLDSPESRAQANVIMNDALGSFLNSPDNAVELSPQSYSYLQENLQSIPSENIRLNWDSLQVDDAGRVQSYTESYLLNDPETKSILEGTHVATPRGVPKVVYLGTIDPEGTSGNSVVWFSSDPKQAMTNAIDAMKPRRGSAEFGGSEPALRIGGEIFTAEEHAVALAAAVKKFGRDSKQIKDFENLTNPLEAIGLLTPEGKFVKEETAIVNNVLLNDPNVPELDKILMQARARGATTAAPTLIPSLVNMKNPLVVRSMHELDTEGRAAFIEQAKKDGHDGLIVEGEPTQYATWLPDNVIDVKDVSIYNLEKAIYQKMQAMQVASDAAKNPYTYNHAGYFADSQINMLNADSGVNIDALVKETNILKYREQAAKAIGADLEAGRTPSEDRFQAYAVANPPNAALKAELDADDIVIRKAGFMEEIMKLAIGCK